MTKYSRLLLGSIIALMLADFVVRGLVPAFTTGKNDFSDPYVGAWLWRHAENPYDVAGASNAFKLFTRSSIPIVPIYPPTTFVLLAPFGFLPWGWANFLWTLLGVAGVAVIAFSLNQVAYLQRGENKTGDGAADNRKWIISAVVFAFAPFHTSIHVANAAVIATAIGLLGVYLAGERFDVASGILLALATCIKPQLGIWILLFYLVRRRWRLVATGALCGLGLTAIALARIPLSPSQLLSNYTSNLHYWFGPGGQNNFTASNPLRFQLLNLQVVLDWIVGSATAANALAYAVFAVGIAIWAYAIFRGRRASDTLALSSLLALTFLPIYHRVYDVGILTLALCWAVTDIDPPLRNARRATIVLLLLFLAPGQSLLMRAEPYVPPWVSTSWWWNLVLAPHAVWLLFALSATLLYALAVSTGIEPFSTKRLAPSEESRC